MISEDSGISKENVLSLSPTDVLGNLKDLIKTF